MTLYGDAAAIHARLRGQEFGAAQAIGDDAAVDVRFWPFDAQCEQPRVGRGERLVSQPLATVDELQHGVAVAELGRHATFLP